MFGRIVRHDHRYVGNHIGIERADLPFTVPAAAGGGACQVDAA